LTEEGREALRNALSGVFGAEMKIKGGLVKALSISQILED